MTGPEPTVPEPPRRRVPLLVVVGLVLAGLVGCVWAYGGFEKAQNRLVLIEPGTTVDMGPMTIAAQRAVATFSDIGQKWSVEVYGRCQNTGDKTLVATEDRLAVNGFGLQDPRTKKVYGDALVSFDDRGLTLSEGLNPGLPPSQCVVTFDLDADYIPANFITFGVSQVEYIDSSVTGTGEMVWSATRVGYRMNLPLIVVQR